MKDSDTTKIFHNDREVAKIFSVYGQHVLERHIDGGSMHDFKQHLP